MSFYKEAFSSPQCGAPLTSKEPRANRRAVSTCSMEALGLPQNGTPLTPKEQPASRRAVSICSMEAFSLPQKDTPLTAKEQPARRWAVSICSMEADVPQQAGRTILITGANTGNARERAWSPSAAAATRPARCSS